MLTHIRRCFDAAMNFIVAAIEDFFRASQLVAGLFPGKTELSPFVASASEI
ncbi:MAG: hypothetical protein [Olavius algarvensis Delta 4 endosymbiont]|nr:MAG: hypothetical protein [Olavius algarvensis Delta 4 endosymbiont]